jgi:hypothetical protein
MWEPQPLATLRASTVFTGITLPLLCKAKAVIRKFSKFVAEKWLFKSRLMYLFLDLTLKVWDSHMTKSAESKYQLVSPFLAIWEKKKKCLQNYKFHQYYILYNTSKTWKNILKGWSLKGHKKNDLWEVTRSCHRHLRRITIWEMLKRGSVGWWMIEYGIGTA